MTVVLELDQLFVRQENIALDAEDLRYGFEHGFLKSTAVVELAAHEVGRGSSDPVLQDLASLLRNETHRVPEVLRSLDDPERIHDPRESRRKWLYLQLKAAYGARDRITDPLGLVEELYADFDYPPSIASFVRYMPLRPGDEAGEDALMRRWAEFLHSEHRSLARPLR